MERFFNQCGVTGVHVAILLALLFSLAPPARALTTVDSKAPGVGKARAESPVIVAQIRLKLKMATELSGSRKSSTEGAPMSVYGAARLKSLGLISEENLKIATGGRPGVAVGKRTALVRLEPRRSKRKRVLKKVWKPWVQTLMQTVSLSGYVFDFYQRQKTGDSDAEEYNTIGFNAKLSARTYIWRPWFATFGGGLGLAADDTQSNINPSSSNTIIGDLSLSVFPTSRFPFSAEYVKNKTDLTGDLIGTSTEQEIYSLKQRYQARKGGSYYASYDHRDVMSSYRADINLAEGVERRESKSKTVSDSFILSASRRFGAHDLDINTNYIMSRREIEKEDYDTLSVITIHRYNPSQTMAMENSANYYNVKDRFYNTGITENMSLESDRDIIQVLSNTLWRPESGKLTVNGGARYFGTVDERGIVLNGSRLQSSSTSNATGTLYTTANYKASQNTDIFGSFDYNKTLDPPGGSYSSNQGAGVSFVSDEVEFLKMRYSFQLSGAIQNQVSDERDTLILRPRVGHGFRKDFRTGSSSNLAFSFNQTYSLSHYVQASHTGYYVPRSQTQQNMGHSVSLAWITRDQFGQASFRLSASDSRTRGLSDRDDEQVSQLVYFQANVDRRIGRFSKVFADWTTQFSGGTPKTEKYEQYITSRGILAYRSSRFLKMRGLSFYSEIRVADESVIPSFGDENDRERFAWENRLEFRLGRLEALALYRLAEINNVRQDILMLRIVRNFGN